MPALEAPTAIGAVPIRNRLYRAPLLEVVGNRPKEDGARILTRELLPSAESGIGLLFQGSSIVTPTGGRTAPGLARAHDRDTVLSWKPAVDAVHAAGAKLFMQVGHGALQCMEAWHAEYRARHPDVVTLAVDEPPWWFKASLASGFLKIPHLRVMSEEDLREMARAFGRAARHAFEAGYDGMHLASANSSIFQELWSPAFNRRKDAFGGRDVEERSAFARLAISEMRRATRPDFPIVAKVPTEAVKPFFVRDALTEEDGVRIARVLEDAGVDAVVPVKVGVTRDQSVARGKFPKLAWDDPRFAEGYARTFGSEAKARLVKAANRAAARLVPFEAAWNASYCARVKARVGVPVLCEGGIRSRAEMDRILDGQADLVGFARPLYAEPLLARRLLRDPAAAALCESCNNCAIPQVNGLPGVCRTPHVLAARGRLEREGAYAAEAR